ncbi:hypothetical protein GUJ93_ZPchr0009g1937 [Zizania palustris]|uniref:Uncharacterized protein n=1 Tax=Zizania palustris TaxID=103762 RepID=A0A8J5RRJ2_ZIZPA|nr:hypothetical protein GUJ93_ZPchr0009g1937 [Zizania palustris]
MERARGGGVRPPGTRGRAGGRRKLRRDGRSEAASGQRAELEPGGGGGEEMHWRQHEAAMTMARRCRGGGTGQAEAAVDRAVRWRWGGGASEGSGARKRFPLLGQK